MVCLHPDPKLLTLWPLTPHPNWKPLVACIDWKWPSITTLVRIERGISKQQPGENWPDATHKKSPDQGAFEIKDDSDAGFNNRNDVVSRTSSFIGAPKMSFPLGRSVNLRLRLTISVTDCLHHCPEYLASEKKSPLFSRDLETGFCYCLVSAPNTYSSKRLGKYTQSVILAK